MTRMAPATRYARSGGVNIAYQVVGDGPFDLVVIPIWVSRVAGSGLAFEERGEHELRGVPGRWRLAAVRA